MYVPLLAALLLLLCLHSVGKAQAQEELVGLPPTIALPIPNAYDTYIRAGKSLVDVALIDDSSKWTTAENAAVVNKNGRALEIFAEGLQQQFRNPPIRTLSIHRPELAVFRRLGRLLQLDSRVKATNENWPAAISRELDLLQFGVQIPKGGDDISVLIGVTIKQFAIETCRQTFDHLTAADARAATTRLAAIIATATPVSETLQEEKWCYVAEILDMFRNAKGDWRSNFKLENGIGVYQGSKKQLLDGLMQYIDKLSENAKLPFQGDSHCRFPMTPSAN